MTGLQPTETKLRKLDKKKGYCPYTEEEKKQYPKVAAPLGSLLDPCEDPGSRAITALDDFMISMKYVEDLVQD